MNYQVLQNEIMRIEYSVLRDTQNYQGIADALNTQPLIGNPQPQQQTPKRLTMIDIFTAITPTEARALYMIPGYRADVEKAVLSGDRQALAMYIAIAGNDLGNSSRTKLQALLAETEADPAWREKVQGQSRAQVLGLGQVQASDVQRVSQ